MGDGSDKVLNGYSEWLNEQLFLNKGQDDVILWLGDDRWLLTSNLDPGHLFVVSLKRAALQ